MQHEQAEYGMAVWRLPEILITQDETGNTGKRTNTN